MSSGGFGQVTSVDLMSGMQTPDLQIVDILKYAARAHPKREIVSRLVDEPIWRYDYKTCLERVSQCANALRRLGVQQGDRVASLAWNTHRHLELFYAVPGVGAVLHTVNPRLSEDQIVYTINHAGSTILFYDKNFQPLIERIAPRIQHVCAFIVLAEHAPVGAIGYEGLIAGHSTHYSWPQVDERSGAFLCYTSGTTGDPKGVLYSQRSVVLHAMATGLAGAFGFDAFDVIMPCASMFHATAWGLPFSASVNGSKLVLPCDKMDGASLQELIIKEGVTFSGGVPTIWTMYLSHLEKTGETTGELKRVCISGSAMPMKMAETFTHKYGVKVLQAWGMTELCPIGVVSTPTPEIAQGGAEAMSQAIWTRAGRLQFGLDLKIVDDNGAELPWDGTSAGALMCKGPWTIRRYFRKDQDATTEDGWFDTGDIATIDSNGFMRITDRKKDVIKSGGEWISSIDIENAAAACPGVRIAAVVGVPHPKWDERPVLVIERHDGAVLNEGEVYAFLEPRIVKWWKPDAVFFDAVPLTATGKIDKKALRARYADALQSQPLRLVGT
jgi:3-(methylthio)propionyl---CoA ligase